MSETDEQKLADGIAMLTGATPSGVTLADLQRRVEDIEAYIHGLRQAGNETNNALTSISELYRACGGSAKEFMSPPATDTPRTPQTSTPPAPSE